MKMFGTTLMFLFLGLTMIFAQKDTVWTKDGNVFAGKFKSMDRGVLYFGTDDAFKDYEIKWEQVLAIKTINHVKLNNSKGTLVEGSLLLDSMSRDTIFILTNKGKDFVRRNQVGFIDHYKLTFREKSVLEINLGFTQAKQNNTVQFSASLKLGYKARLWEAIGDLSRFANRVDTIYSSRTEAGATAQLFFPYRWFLYGQYRYFSSSQLNLSYRSTPILGIGNAIIDRRNMRLNIIGGINYNEEKYSGVSTRFTSTEAYALLNFEYFPTKNIDYTLLFVTNPSLVTSRVRYQINTRLKFDFYKNFNFSVAYKYNFDSRPQVDVSGYDYLFELALGWKLN